MARLTTRFQCWTGIVLGVGVLVHLLWNVSIDLSSRSKDPHRPNPGLRPNPGQGKYVAVTMWPQQNNSRPTEHQIEPLEHQSKKKEVSALGNSTAQDAAEESTQPAAASATSERLPALGNGAHLQPAVLQRSLQQAIVDHHLPPHVPQSVLDSEDVASLYQTEWRDYPGKLVNSSLRKIPPELAVEAGHVYTLWDRKRWTERGGEPREGLHVKANHDLSRIKRVWIWGERNSCTTLITKLLRANFEQNLTGCKERECVTDGRPWKHAFMRRASLQSNTTLHLLVTRHPYEWIKSMHSHPHFAPLHTGVPMLDFLTLEWVSFREGGMAADKRDGERQKMQPATRPRAHSPAQPAGRGWTELAYDEQTEDRDPDTRRRLPTVTALREAKIRDFFRATRNAAFTGHIPCRDFFLNPAEILEQLAERYQLTRARSSWRLDACVLVRGVCREKGGAWDVGSQQRKREHYLNGTHMQAFNQSTLDILNAWVDPLLEASLGNLLFHDVALAATPYNHQTRCSLHLPVTARAGRCPPAEPPRSTR